MCDKPTVNITLKAKHCKHSSQIRNKTRKPIFTTLILSRAEVLARAIKEVKETNGIGIGQEEAKYSHLYV